MLFGIVQYTGMRSGLQSFSAPPAPGALIVGLSNLRGPVTPDLYRGIKAANPAEILLLPPVLWETPLFINAPSTHLVGLSAYRRRQLAASGLDTIGRVLAHRDLTASIIGDDGYAALYAQIVGVAESSEEDLWLG